MLDPNNRAHFGDLIWAAQIADGVIEGAIDESLGEGRFCDKVGYDYYDASIEIMLKHDIEVKPELFTTLAEFGITMGWINFSDGTEVHFHNSKPGERRKVAHPRWSEEQRLTES